LPDAIRALALQAGFNIQFDPKLLNTVGPDGHSIPVTPPIITVKWKKLTAKQALVTLLDNWSWQMVMDPRSKIGRITAKDPNALEPLVTRVFRLHNSLPTNLVADLMRTMSPRSVIINDTRTMKLIVRTTERELPSFEDLLAKLDTPDGDPASEPLQTWFYELKHSNPSDMIAELKPLLSPRDVVVADARTHRLIIRATTAEWENIIPLIDKLDIPAVTDPKASGAP
jgi:type II secretory pathway component GspD/PulD (secretin)